MNKTFIEKRIEEKAEISFDDNLRNLLKSIEANPIGAKFRFNVVGVEKTILVREVYGNSSLESIFEIKKNEKINTNFEIIKKELIEKYIQVETDNLLNKINNLSYLFNQEG